MSGLHEAAATSVGRGRKTCPCCARSFGCGHGGPGCWCEGVTLAPATLAELRALTGDCLCPACLGGYARRDGAAQAG